MIVFCSNTLELDLLIELKAVGLWYSAEELGFQILSTFTTYWTDSKPHTFGSGFITDLLTKLERYAFSEALAKTLLEWRKRWNLQTRGFLSKIGLVYSVN